MPNLKKAILLSLGGLFFFILGGIFWPKGISNVNPSPKIEGTQVSSSPSAAPESLVKVTRVIDGDTIEIEGGKRLRLIGIDTPELNKSGAAGCFGREAADYLTKLLNGQMVRLEKDVSETDRYNRLLRYIYLNDIFVNDKLVRDGYARVYTYPPDVKYKDKFLESEKYARENNLGLWSKCSISPSLSISRTPNASPVTNLDLNINCSSNTYNCSDFKTQSEAQNVFNYCMKSVGYDVHKLDRDGDGRVCETLP